MTQLKPTNIPAGEVQVQVRQTFQIEYNKSNITTTITTPL